MRSLATRAISERMEAGQSVSQALAAVLDGLGRDYDADVGIIAVDASGTPFAAHRTRDMPHAHFSGAGPIVSLMRV